MATYTQNYTLHQWEDSDDFLRSDFNTDFAKIDTAIKGVADDMTTAIAAKCEVVFGTYTGNGAASRTIDLGFTPSAVLLEHFHSYRYITNSGSFGGLMLPDADLFVSTNVVGNITTNGFTVYYTSGIAMTNASSQTYRYIAFK